MSASKGRWDVSSLNRRGTAHWWNPIKGNKSYLRSHCGQVEHKENLQGKALLVTGVLNVPSV